MFEELSQHILDIAMNSISANAKKVQISILESRRHDRLVLRVRDDGCGMDAAMLERVLARRWSSRTNGANPSPRPGLPAPDLRDVRWPFSSAVHPRSGTSVTASMRLSHIDRRRWVI